MILKRRLRAEQHGSRRHGDLWQTAVSDRFALNIRRNLAWFNQRLYCLGKGQRVGGRLRREMPRQRNEEPAMDSEPSSYNRRSYDRSYDSDVQDAPQVRRHDRSDKVVNINTTTQLAVVLSSRIALRRCGDCRSSQGQAYGCPESGADQQGYCPPSGGFPQRCCVCKRRQDQEGCKQYLYYHTLQC